VCVIGLKAHYYCNPLLCKQKSIPFAAVNMTTAVTAIKANLGVTAFAYLFTILAAGWSLLWSIAVSGTMEQTYDCVDGVCSNPNYGFIFLLFLSFFFAHQVIQVSCVLGLFGLVHWGYILHCPYVTNREN
jgi:hypothetical protein